MIKRWMPILCVFASATLADTLTLRDGRTVQGDYAGGDPRTIRLMVGESVQSFRVSDIVSLTIGPGPGGPDGPPAAAPPPQAPPPQPPPQQAAPPQAAPAPAAPPPGAQVSPPPAGPQIPAGTEIKVRMIDPVNSGMDQEGYTYRASVVEPISVRGQIVIPHGADVVVKLVSAHQSGKLTGTTSLTLALQQVQVNGKMVDAYTERVTQTSGSRGKKTAAVVGGAAVLGAVVGGAAGGGAGAAIGAASGGAVGAGVEVLTAGEKVKIPAEAKLTFTLEAPIPL